MARFNIERSAAALVKKFGSPLYVYDSGLIRERCSQLKANFPGVHFYYACKANAHPRVMRLILQSGFGIEAVSPGEIAAAKKAGATVGDIAFTCSSIDEEEIAAVGKQGIRMHLDSLVQVEAFGRHFPGRAISVRLNQGIGAGHHAHVVTGGPDSKFGIDTALLGSLRRIARKYRLRIEGIHQHIGSNVLDTKIFLKAMDALLGSASRFPGLKHIDFGGGFGVPYAPHEKPLDIEALGRKVTRKLADFSKRYGREVRFSFEPGRYPVAEAGSLLVRVNDVKRNPGKTFIGVNSGFEHLIRPAMYGSYHEIVNATGPRGRKEKVTVGGHICESGDVFAKDRMIARPRLGDILVIRNAGAYGYSMSSDYNLRPKPKEVIV